MIKVLPRQRLFTQAALILLQTTALTGCLGVQVIENVKERDPHFQKAQARIEQIHRKWPGRQGQPNRPRLLVHDRFSRELIKLSIPGWMGETCLRTGREEVAAEAEFHLEQRYELNRRSTPDLGKVGLGLLLEIDSEEDRVLIWLE
ncbi:MAG: hypothetical protein ACUVV5_11205 [Candidatus Aminicenantales bacterium]